jgi:2-dehydro-3-deoxyphosphogluconate aldolase/(4S)-4-hydroxy-2-oxoglutarate aldolase
MSLAEQLRACRILPVITVRDPESTVLLTRALLRGGMTAVEITLRTPAALASLQAVKEQVPGVLVAAGTVTNGKLLAEATAAGADFCVSPGVTRALLEAARKRKVSLLPGVSTASEVMLGLDHGLDLFKLFPATAVGGRDLLRAFAGPFPDVRFCPTGGLNAGNYRDFLALPNVICCGGSWMVGPDLVDNGRWNEIEARAGEAMAGAQLNQ